MHSCHLYFVSVLSVWFLLTCVKIFVLLLLFYTVRGIATYVYKSTFRCISEDVVDLTRKENFYWPHSCSSEQLRYRVLRANVHASFFSFFFVVIVIANLCASFVLVTREENKTKSRANYRSKINFRFTVNFNLASARPNPLYDREMEWHLSGYPRVLTPFLGVEGEVRVNERNGGRSAHRTIESQSS